MIFLPSPLQHNYHLTQVNVSVTMMSDAFQRHYVSISMPSTLCKVTVARVGRVAPAMVPVTFFYPKLASVSCLASRPPKTSYTID